MSGRPANFDLIARPYRWLEYLTFGPVLQRCRMHFLPALLNQKLALVLGDGDGRFLARLLGANPQLHAEAIDISAVMLQLLRHNCQAATDRLITQATDARSYAPKGQYDLIVTHFFLDCLTQSELDALVLRIVPHVRAQKALWLVSDFRIPDGPLRRPAQIFIRALYLAFQILTGLHTTRLPDHRAPLISAGFTLASSRTSLFGLLTSELWQLSAHRTCPTIVAMSTPDTNPDPEAPLDPIPDPEPISPSLDQPDPGVFHHDPDHHDPEPQQ